MPCAMWHMFFFCFLFVRWNRKNGLAWMLASVTPGSLPWVVVACPRSSSPLACHHFKVVTPTLSISSLCKLYGKVSIMTTHDIPWCILAIICSLWFYWCQCGPSDFLHNAAVWFHRSLGQIPLCQHLGYAPRRSMLLQWSGCLCRWIHLRTEKIHILSSYVFPHEKEGYCK